MLKLRKTFRMNTKNCSRIYGLLIFEFEFYQGGWVILGDSGKRLNNEVLKLSFSVPMKLSIFCYPILHSEKEV